MNPCSSNSYFRLSPLAVLMAVTPIGSASAQTDRTLVRIEATQPIAEESSMPFRRLPLIGRFTVSRTGPTNASLSVFVLYGGSATSGVDYKPLPWLVSIPAGATSVDLDVAAIPDQVAEPMETVEARLSQCPPLTDPPLGIPCYDVPIDPAHSTARVFIRDDGITTAFLEITAPKEGAQFRLGATIAIEATAIDFEGAITAVDFYDGETKIGESRLFFFVEPAPGTPIYHQFDWTGAAPGSHKLSVQAVNTAGNPVTSRPVAIQVVTGFPIVSIVATRAETSELPCPPNTCRAPVPAPGLFQIQRTGGSTSNSLAVLIRVGGTATPKSDYDPLPELVQIPAGLASVELSVQATFDELSEGDETVVVELMPDPSLSPIPRYQVNPEQNAARVIIHDRTPPPVQPEASIVATDPLAREGTNSAGEINPATFVIRRTGKTNDPLTIFFEIGGTATHGVDYKEITSPVVIPAGHRGVALTVRPNEDHLTEPPETVLVKLIPSPQASPLPSYTLGTPDRAAAIILDNDYPRPPCTRLADGIFNLCIPVKTNGCFRIESTDTLANWTRLCTIPVNDGAAHFLDPNAPDLPRRFYRILPDVCEEGP